MKIKCLVKYDGTNYHGFQKQLNSITIQEIIEKSLKKINNSDITIIMASRTDTGVHANYQVFHFKSKIDLEAELYTRAINTYLPKDIRIISSSLASDDFHSRFSVKSKTYKYYISKEFDVKTHLYSKLVTRELDLTLMNEEAKKIIGTHNFKSFTSKTKYKNYERTVTKSHFEEVNGQIVYTITGTGFLRYMVRSIVGTLISIGLNENYKIDEIIKKEDRRSAGLAAEAKGLFLDYIEY